jgi:hypothetical protein
MHVFSKVSARKVRIGGEQHSGWLPEGFATPLPTPMREVAMTFEITDDGGGNYLLIYHSEDKSVHGDTWHQSIDEAKEVAESSFHIRRDEWKDQP